MQGLESQQSSFVSKDVESMPSEERPTNVENPHIPKDSTPPFEQYTKCENLIMILAYIVVAICPLLLLCCFSVIEQYSRAVIFRLGKVRHDSPSGPGLVFGLYFGVDKLIKIDIRTRSINLSPQAILTKDHVTVTVEAVVYYHVTSPISCLLNIVQHEYTTDLLAIAVLRNVLGKYKLAEVLSSRTAIGLKIGDDINLATTYYGVMVERVEIKDVVLPNELQKAMATEAEGKRLANAKMIVAKGEIQVAENLKQASRIIEENPKIMLLRYLQSLNFIAADNKTSILYPFPFDLVEP